MHAAPNRWRDGATVDRLKHLWQQGLSASQIADIIGGITRNAVIGKAHRLGLSGRVPRKSEFYKAKRRHPKPGRITQNVTPRVRILPDFPAEPVVIHEDIYVAPENRKRLLDLEPNDCRWGIGDPKHPDFHFCDGTKIPGSSYCEFHARQSVQSAQEVDARRLRAMKAA